MAPTRPVPYYLAHLKFDHRKYSFPSCWNSEDKCPLLDVSNHRLRVEYIGEGKNDGEAAAIRADHFVPIQVGVYYFEITVKSKGRDGFIGIGLSQANVSLIRLPGWEVSSYGYHGDDGNIFCASGVGKAYGPTYTVHDTVGCGFNTDDGSVFFTKNGQCLGEAFKISTSHHFYPTVGMRTPAEMVEANFGRDRFVFDIESYIKDRKLALYDRVIHLAGYAAPTSEEFEALILSYMIHYGYSETALSLFRSEKKKASFAPVTEGGAYSANSQFARSFQSEDELFKEIGLVRDRKEIADQVSAGNIDAAISRISQVYPRLFRENRKIRFKLMSQAFIEMIRSTYPSEGSAMEIDVDSESIDAILSFGKQLQLEYESEKDSEYADQLSHLFSIMTEADPYSSPMACLLDVGLRAALASELLAAILMSENRPPYSPCELLVKQTICVLSELSSLGLGQPAFVDIEKDFLASKNGHSGEL